MSESTWQTLADKLDIVPTPFSSGEKQRSQRLVRGLGVGPQGTSEFKSGGVGVRWRLEQWSAAGANGDADAFTADSDSGRASRQPNTVARHRFAQF